MVWRLQQFPSAAKRRARFGNLATWVRSEDASAALASYLACRCPACFGVAWSMRARLIAVEGESVRAPEPFSSLKFRAQFALLLDRFDGCVDRCLRGARVAHHHNADFRTQ